MLQQRNGSRADLQSLPLTARSSLAPCRSFERLLFSIEQAWWHYEVRSGYSAARKLPTVAVAAASGSRVPSGMFWLSC